MKNNFERCLDIVLQHEGGFVNHPKDPGGATNKGITLKTYQRHFGMDKTVNDLITIPDAHVQSIYKYGYWLPCRCDDLPIGLDLAVFDYAVNSGPTRAIRTLQQVSGAKVDGLMGPNTVAAANNTQLVGDMISDFCIYRLRFLESLDTWDTFGRGWGRRVEDTKQKALAMDLANQ